MAPPLTTGNLCGHCLKQFDTDGNYLGSIGQCGQNTQGTGLNPVQFDKVTDIAFDSEGYLWVTDGDINGLNNRVLQIDPNSQEVIQQWSAPGDNYGKAPKEFHLPHSICIDPFDRVWIADALNSSVQVIRTDGTFLQKLVCFGSDGVYGLHVCKVKHTETYRLFVCTCSVTNPISGIVWVFEVTEGNLPVPNQYVAECKLTINLAQGTTKSMLHMIETTEFGDQFFLSVLGGDLFPQKWIKVFTPLEQ